MSFNRWQKLRERMIAKVVLLAEAWVEEEEEGLATAGAVVAAIVLSLMAAI
jgi:hypothetical protein